MTHCRTGAVPIEDDSRASFNTSPCVRLASRGRRCGSDRFNRNECLTSRRELARQINAVPLEAASRHKQNDNASGPRDKTIVGMGYENADADDTADCCYYLNHHDHPLRYAERNGFAWPNSEQVPPDAKASCRHRQFPARTNTRTAHCLAALLMPTRSGAMRSACGRFDDSPSCPLPAAFRRPNAAILRPAAPAARRFSDTHCYRKSSVIARSFGGDGILLTVRAAMAFRPRGTQGNVVMIEIVTAFFGMVSVSIFV